jgi:hypothetical protein
MRVNALMSRIFKNYWKTLHGWHLLLANSQTLVTQKIMEMSLQVIEMSNFRLLVLILRVLANWLYIFKKTKLLLMTLGFLEKKELLFSTHQYFIANINIGFHK